jgi:hypothetical protein
MEAIDLGVVLARRHRLLEAWDVERVFRRRRQRLTGSACALLIGAALVLAPAGTPAWAQTQDFLCPVPEASLSPVDPLSAAPDTPRLMHQTLSSQAAQQSIKNILQQPPFTNLKPVTGWRLAKEESAARRTATGNPHGAFIEWLERLANSTLAFARILETVLWAVVTALSALVIGRYRAWFAAFVPRRTPRPAGPPHEVPSQLFGLQVSAQTLPDDIAGSAERLWATQPREALGLLYRALLSRLLTEYRLPVTSADTEGEILARIGRLGQPALDRFSRALTLHWQNLAYGHQTPPASARSELCDGWRRLFSDEAPR